MELHAWCWPVLMCVYSLRVMHVHVAGMIATDQLLEKRLTCSMAVKATSRGADAYLMILWLCQVPAVLILRL